jgi:hypothetical protein
MTRLKAAHLPRLTKILIPLQTNLALEFSGIECLTVVVSLQHRAALEAARSMFGTSLVLWRDVRIDPSLLFRSDYRWYPGRSATPLPRPHVKRAAPQNVASANKI